MKFVLNGGLIIGTCDGANVSSLYDGNIRVKTMFGSMQQPSDRYLD